MAANSQTTRVLAVVGPGSANNGRYNIDLGSWELADKSFTMLFTQDFDPEVDDRALLKSVEELQKILLALFITDSIPRRIFCFEYGDNLTELQRMKFWRVFGIPRTHLETEQIVETKSFSRVGLFNIEHVLRPLDFVAGQSIVQPWFEFFSNNPHIASSLLLIQESYGLAHELVAGLRITNFAELSTVLLLLVSGLESVFTNPDDSHADISFKFRTVGAAFYSKYVNRESLGRAVGFHTGKFTYKEFKDILNIIYGLRSSIAHGGFGFNFFEKEKIQKSLDKLFEKVGVSAVDNKMKTVYFANLMAALGILEVHILEIYKGAKENLNKGVNILDEILEDQN